MAEGRAKDAYYALGEAMHPIMDSTAPSHEGFQIWQGVIPLLHSGIHLAQELMISNEQLSRTNDLLRTFYSDNK